MNLPMIYKTYQDTVYTLLERSALDRHWYYMAANFSVFVDGDHGTLPKLYCLPKLHKKIQ